MNLKLLFKALSFSFVTSFVFADDCNEIKEYLEKKSLNYTTTIEKCSMNDQGKVIELKVNNEDLQEEDVNKILSYDSIKNLEYIVVFNKSEEPDSLYSYPIIPHPGYSGFPSVIVNLSELEELNFNYNHYRSIKYFPDIKQISIEDEIFKMPKNIKILTLSQIDLSNENLKELSTLTNLEEINFNHCKFGEDGFTHFENNNKIIKLSIINSKAHSNAIPDHIGKIKSLKKVYIEKNKCKDESYDFTELENLESLYIDLLKECNFDLSKNEKLSELSIVGPNDIIFGVGISSPLSLKLPNSLKKIYFSDLTLSSDNYKAIASLPDLEELTMIYYGNSDKLDIKSLECHDKLRKLVIYPSIYRSQILDDNNMDFLNELVNLTYLDFSENGLTKIPQLENLKKLEHLKLSSNLFNKFPHGLAKLENIEYINLSANDIYDKLPESLNKLENLKYFYIVGNKNIIGKVLLNKNLEQCVYSDNYDLCIPKDYELNCLKDSIISFKTCEEGINIEESTDGQCGEGHGKCPEGQCCNKDGECGTTEDYCLVSKQCQMNYGDCIDECEQIYNQLKKLEGEYRVDGITCRINEQGKAQNLVLESGDNTYIKQLENLSDLESISLKCVWDVENYKPLLTNKNLISLIVDNRCDGGNGEFPEEILNLTNLKTLILKSKSIKAIPKNIKNLKNLENLDLLKSNLKDLPDEFGELENLKILNLERNKFTKFPKVIANLKSLEELNLMYNDIDDEIPESYNNLSELKSINFSGTKNIKGKILQNEKLVTCKYDYEWKVSHEHYPLCQTGNEKCLKESLKEVYPFCPGFPTTPLLPTTTTTTEKPAITTSITSEKPNTIITFEKPTTSTTSENPTITTTTSTTSENPTITTTTSVPPVPVKGRCGEGIGKCPSGQCCSKYGWCGKTDDYCAQGCLSEFGDCKNSPTPTTTTTTTTKISESSVKGKCGPGIGSCSSGYCCSKYGWCGKSYSHCAVSEGCQSAYGLCSENNSSIEGKCGEGYGKCPSDHCCSKEGWCGKTDDHCSVSKGCQSEFGQCN